MTRDPALVREVMAERRHFLMGIAEAVRITIERTDKGDVPVSRIPTPIPRKDQEQ